MKTVKKSAAKKMVKKAAPKKMMAKPASKMMQAPEQESPMMKMGGKMPKANFGKALANMGANASRKLLPGIIDKNASNEMFGLNKPAAPANSMMKKGGAVKAKKGGSFPDLNKDGKITKADILKGRGVIAKKGASVKKMQYGGSAASMVPPMKSGGKMKKCKMGCY
jgi:hypothetical protein